MRALRAVAAGPAPAAAAVPVPAAIFSCRARHDADPARVAAWLAAVNPGAITSILGKVDLNSQTILVTTIGGLVLADNAVAENIAKAVNSLCNDFPKSST
jgi:hypothetical protein